MTNGIRNVLIWMLIGIVFLYFIIGIRAVLLPFVLGALIAYFLDPVADRLQRNKIPRSYATVLITIAFFSFGVCVLLIIVPLIAEQLSRLINDIPAYTQIASDFYREHLQSAINRLPAEQENTFQEALGNFKHILASMLTDLFHGVISSGATLLNLFSLLLITPVVTFYLLRDWDHILAKLDALLPRAYAATIREQVQEIDRTMSGFIHGQMMVCATLATFYIVGFSLVGLNFSVVIGAAAGFLIIIPYVGWAVCAVAGMLVAILQYDNTTMIAVVGIIFLIGQVIEGYLLTPKLVGEKVGLHPVWLIFGMLAGGALFGFVGVLIAVPVTAIIGVLTRFTIGRYLQSELYRGDSTLHIGHHE